MNQKGLFFTYFIDKYNFYIPKQDNFNKKVWQIVATLIQTN